MSVTTAQATTLLENILFESPTLAAANAAQWVAQSQTNSADATVAGLAAAMANSAEASIAEQVVRTYEGALGRVPSGNEAAFYVNIAESGLSASQIAQGAGAVSTATWGQIATYFADSPEFNYLTAGNSSVIPMLYENILGRAPSTDETAFYQKALDAGAAISTLVQYFVNSPEYQGKTNAVIATELATYGANVVAGSASRSDPIVQLGALDAAAGAVDIAGTATAVTTLTVTTSATSVTNLGNTGSTSTDLVTLGESGGVLTFSGVKAGFLFGLSDHSALTVDPVTIFDSSVTSNASAFAALANGIAAHHVASGIYDGNTYVFESATGLAGSSQTTSIEVIGIHTIALGSSLGVIVIAT